MARIEYSDLMPENSGIFDVFSNEPDFLTEEHSATYANFGDEGSTNRFILQGEGFKYHDGLITKGTVEDILFTDQDTDVLFSVSNLKINISDLTSALTEKGLGAAAKMLFNANDKWVGSDANDYLTGFKGNDKLFGGDGGDTFGFVTGDGKDKILDFNRDDGDVIDVHGWKGISNLSHVKSHAEDHGDNVWITMNHDILIIAHLHKADLSAGDFLF